MRLDVHFTPGEVAAAELGDRVAVVIDVLRATSSMVEALANGARGVYPVATVDEAVRMARQLGTEATLLCGERRSLRIEGFDLGNSPREFTPDRVEGRHLVMTTTNGTPAIAACAGARRTLVASFLNLDAVVEALAGDGGPATVVCAGRERRFALEDALCAGALALRLRARLERVEPNDAAYAAAALARGHSGDLAGVLRRTAAGRQLVEAELGEDVDFCATLDRHALVPHLSDRRITL